MFSAFKRFTTKTRDNDDLAHVYARLFRTTDGQAVLEHLHQQTLFRLTDPFVTTDQLRFIEGQRQLVLLICQMMAKAHNNPSSPPTETPWKIS